MASDYSGFPVTFENDQGVVQSVGPGVEVLIRAQGGGSDEAESPLTTDSNGEIAAGTLAGVVAGTKVHFRVEEFQGMAFSVAQITT
jgi:hypothetical protein